MARISNALLALAVLVPAVFSAAQAEANNRHFVYQKIYQITPLCHLNPDHPWVGRVTGHYDRGRLSWTGCFINLRECESWRRMANSEVDPPRIQNVCEPRW
ncbi:MAG: hypothetical protein AAF318_17090 [Pseudomonadota bacterium]